MKSSDPTTPKESTTDAAQTRYENEVPENSEAERSEESQTEGTCSCGFPTTQPKKATEEQTTTKALRTTTTTTKASWAPTKTEAIHNSFQANLDWKRWALNKPVEYHA